jgi:WD40 repeat protein
MHRQQITLALFGSLSLVALARAAEPNWEWAPAIKHRAGISAVSWSPDGSKILTTGADGHLIIWDAKTALQLRAISGVWATANLRPAWSGDSSRLLTSSTANNKSILWDVVSGKRVRSLYGHEYEVFCGCLNHDGSLAVLGGFRGKIQLWNPKTGEIGQTLTDPATKDLVLAIDISNDGTMAITAQESAAIVWDVAKGKALHTLRGHRGKIKTVALSQDGKTALTGSDDKTVIAWDTKIGMQRYTLGEHANWTEKLGCSADGSVLLAGSSLDLSLWDGKTGKQIRAVPFKEHADALAVSPDGSQFAIARGSDLGIFDVKTGERLPLAFGTTEAVLNVRWHPRSQQLFTGSQDQHAMIWGIGPDAKTQSLTAQGVAVSSANWDREGQFLLTGDSGRAATLWKARTLEKVKSFPLGFQVITGGGLTCEAGQVLVATKDKTAVIWDCNKGENLRTLTVPEALLSGHWNPDGTRVLSVPREPTLTTWDAKTGKVDKAMGIYLARATSANWNHDGTRILATYSSFDTSITHIWDAATGKRVRTFEGHAAEVTTACWNPEATQIATGSTDRTIIVWDVATGKQVRTLRGHAERLTSLGWSESGKWLASASTDGTARVWDAKTGKEICRLMIFDGGKEWLVLGPDGEYDGSEGAPKQSLYRRAGTLEFVAADQYLKKRTAGLLPRLLAQ